MRVVLLISVVHLVIGGIVALQESELIFGRSAEYDRMIDRFYNRQKRQTECLVQMKGQCSRTQAENIQHDRLGRRGTNSRLSPVMHQGMCGNCWAFSAASAVTDLRNLNGESVNYISTEYTTRCAARPRYRGYGCCGGPDKLAYQWFKNTGSVDEVCLPYDFTSSKLPPEANRDWKVDYPVLTCQTTCNDGSPVNPSSYKLHDFRCYKPRNDNMIQQALDWGYVVSASMYTYEGFDDYGCGIICDDPLKRGTSHSVVIVDYGSVDGVNFWVAKNSFGTDFGEQGYFRIKWGVASIGRRFCIPMLRDDDRFPASTDPGDDSSSTEDTCASEDVPNPADNQVVMMAINYAFQYFVTREKISCRNGNRVNSLDLVDILDANAQTVEGALIEVELIANLEGCGANEQKTIDMTVWKTDEGTFAVTSYEFSKGEVLSVSMLMMLVMLALGMLLNN